MSEMITISTVQSNNTITWNVLEVIYKISLMSDIYVEMSPFSNYQNDFLWSLNNRSKR